MTGTDRKLRVFLCHASQDKPVVRELYQRLLAEGWIDPWLDEENLLPGQEWRLHIEETVERSDIVVICLSNNSVNKEGFVQKELRYAREISLEKPEDTIFLVPLRLENCNVPRGLRFIQWIDYFGKEKDSNYRSLLSSLNLRKEQVIIREKQAIVQKRIAENLMRVQSNSVDSRTETDGNVGAGNLEQMRAELREYSRLENEIRARRGQLAGDEAIIREETKLLRSLEKINSSLSVDSDDSLANDLWQTMRADRKYLFMFIRFGSQIALLTIGAFVVLGLIRLSWLGWVIGLIGFFYLGFLIGFDGFVKKLAITPDLKKKLQIQSEKLKRLKSSYDQKKSQLE